MINKEVVIRANDEAQDEYSLGARLRAVRVELYGEHGVELVGARLGVSPRSWRRYEQLGELMPVQTLLRFIELTGVDPLWLMRGEGMKFRNQRRWNSSMLARTDADADADADVDFCLGR